MHCQSKCISVNQTQQGYVSDDTSVAKVTTNFHPRVNSYIKLTAYSILCARLRGRACLLFSPVILTLVQVVHPLKTRGHFYGLPKKLSR